MTKCHELKIRYTCRRYVICSSFLHKCNYIGIHTRIGRNDNGEISANHYWDLRQKMERERANVREKLRERKKRERIIVAASVGVTYNYIYRYSYNQLNLSNPRKRPLTLHRNGVQCVIRVSNLLNSLLHKYISFLLLFHFLCFLLLDIQKI